MTGKGPKYVIDANLDFLHNINQLFYTEPKKLELEKVLEQYK
jgi:hypothetical protein